MIGHFMPSKSLVIQTIKNLAWSGVNEDHNAKEIVHSLNTPLWLTAANGQLMLMKRAWAQKMAEFGFHSAWREGRLQGKANSAKANLLSGVRKRRWGVGKRYGERRGEQRRQKRWGWKFKKAPVWLSGLHEWALCQFRHSHLGEMVLICWSNINCFLYGFPGRSTILDIIVLLINVEKKKHSENLLKVKSLLWFSFDKRKQGYVVISLGLVNITILTVIPTHFLDAYAFFLNQNQKHNYACSSHLIHQSSVSLWWCCHGASGGGGALWFVRKEEQWTG